MRTSHFLVIAFFFISLVSFKTDRTKGVKFITSGWSDMVKVSKAEDKPLFVYIRTKTCHTSKKMDGVFQNEAVAKILTENFVCGQLNPDNPIDNLRVSSWGATGVPTYAFLNSKRRVVLITNGYKAPNEMIELVQRAMEKLGNSPVN